MTYIDFEQEIRNDIERYRRMVEMYRSSAKTGEVDGGLLIDRTDERIGYLQGIISNLEKLLQANTQK